VARENFLNTSCELNKMGRVRSKLVKTVGMEAFSRYRDKFRADFEHNKQVLPTVIGVHSKKLRNMIAGYITKLVKKEGE